MQTHQLPNEALLPALAEIVNTLTSRYDKHQVQQMLWWMGWTLWKWYDNEEQADTIKENCKEWLSNPDCFLDK